MITVIVHPGRKDIPVVKISNAVAEQNTPGEKKPTQAFLCEVIRPRIIVVKELPKNLAA